MIDKLHSEYLKLKSLESKKLNEALAIEYTYESNKIEGNTLTLKETELVINKGLTIANKPLKDHLEAINHQEAIGLIEDMAKNNMEITEKTIKDIHYLILKGIDTKNAGKYREVQVMIQGSEHIPPSPMIVPEKMEELMQWYQDNQHKMHPVDMAAELHLRLVSIHPFIDGNGRTSRLLMNLFLIQNQYPIINIKGDTTNRLAYYDVLENSQLNHNQLFIDYIKEQMIKTLERYIKIMNN